ncbi:uncharacterized protein LOC143254976 isoform X2 [Tachypleus tridentatus]|uniref:uncharacterized protein LOC143254976 isoform X2 n=1 Tax=Tachypleus tridentatus TaxID=6853 RepID=UPI003FD5EB81
MATSAIKFAFLLVAMVVILGATSARKQKDQGIPKFKQLFCHPKITDSTRLQRLNCVKNNLPSQLAQAWEDCSATKFPGAEPLQYIKQMCNDNNKLKEMFVCVTEKLANGEVDIASLKKGLKLQPCLQMKG